MKKKKTSSEARYLIEQQLAKEQAGRESAHTRAKQSVGKAPPITSHHLQPPNPLE